MVYIGSIDAKELRAAKRALGLDVNKEEIRHMLQEVGAEESGRVDLTEFVALMT